MCSFQAIIDKHAPLKQKVVRGNQAPFMTRELRKAVKNGHDSLRYFGTKVWNMMPNYIKSADSLEKFKIKIKQWTPNNCTCRLCKPYIHRIGYVNID